MIVVVQSTHVSEASVAYCALVILVMRATHVVQQSSVIMITVLAYATFQFVGFGIELERDDLVYYVGAYRLVVIIFQVIH